MTANEDWPRLGDYVRERRNELRMTQSGVQRVGGPSSAKVREIENKRTTTLSPSKRRDLERALKWTDGSVDAILRGDEPGLKRWRNDGVGLAGLIPTAPPVDDQRPARVPPEQIPHGPELLSASRQIHRAIQEFAQDEHSRALDSLMGARATLTVVIGDISQQRPRVGDTDDLEETPQAEGSTGEAQPPKKSGAGDPRFGKPTALPTEFQGDDPDLPSLDKLAAESGGQKGIETPPGEEGYSQDPDDHESK
ncbi:IrrE-like protein [Gordonia phage Crater]|uniref:Immunity repressor n=1 Tax=Gordonia phage Phistory TaxID=2301694 RepID=A0A385E209_9CAUD|nr:immunity repressor [Gordonia phage Phistory]AXQ64759.1 immunity repressor [Gordonia phage Phistory]WNM69760.1 IrrE-like protein [Gordonia phage Crater]